MVISQFSLCQSHIFQVIPCSLLLVPTSCCWLYIIIMFHAISHYIPNIPNVDLSKNRSNHLGLSWDPKYIPLRYPLRYPLKFQSSFESWEKSQTTLGIFVGEHSMAMQQEPRTIGGSYHNIRPIFQGYVSWNIPRKYCHKYGTFTYLH
jgi:hypothetical protein